MSTGILKKEDVAEEAKHVSNGEVKVHNNWSDPGPAAFDFRSAYFHSVFVGASTLPYM